MNEQPTKTDAPPSWKARLVAVLLSTLFALFMAEWVAADIRDGAFPFLNIYEADAELGVRLEANATTATRSREGRITEIATNAQGFRGPDWTLAVDIDGRTADESTPVQGRVLLIGDSQMLGYGVDFPDTIAAQLGGKLGAGFDVLPAAAPTWGPHEYVAIADELVPKFRPQIVVVVANAANDWFETSLPNSRRMTERDGWAARILHGTTEPTAFPFRRTLMGRSHLVYAARQLFNRGASGPPPALAVGANRILEQLPTLTKPVGPHRSRITPFLVQIQDLCARQGCQVVAAFLPMDVQVHPAEWTKYTGEKPADMRPSWVLGAAYLADARALRIPTVDWMPALRAASNGDGGGAFLPDDYHMNSKGHAACADALAPTIRRVANAMKRRALSQNEPADLADLAEGDR